MAKINIEYDFTSCKSCPFLKEGNSFGEDGRGTDTIYFCSKGAFGGRDQFHKSYERGYNRIPKVPPCNCPYIESDINEVLADRLDMALWRLKEILEHENIILVKNKENKENKIDYKKSLIEKYL